MLQKESENSTRSKFHWPLLAVFVLQTFRFPAPQTQILWGEQKRSAFSGDAASQKWSAFEQLAHATCNYLLGAINAARRLNYLAIQIKLASAEGLIVLLGRARRRQQW